MYLKNSDFHDSFFGNQQSLWGGHESIPAYGKKYIHYIEPYLKQSNAYGNVYFSCYFEWQGICREKWFHDCINSDMLKDTGVLFTKKAHNEYIRESFPFMKVKCVLRTDKIRNSSFYLNFEFYDVDSKNLLSKGYQQIVFADKTKKPSRIPKEIIGKIKEYEIV